MQEQRQRTRVGALIIGLALATATTGAIAQTNVKVPPKRDNLPEFKSVERSLPTGVRVDPETGMMSGYGQPIQPVHIPFDGVLPAGTIPQEDREAGRPMRPGEDPWIPDGTGYWPPLVDDIEAPAAQPLMQDYQAIGYNGHRPPDPDLARGYDYQVCVTNDDFAVYDSCGTELFRRDINDFLGLTDGFFDPKVIFDPWAGRWVMMYHLKNISPQESRLIFVISADSTPFGLPGSNSWYYSFNVLQDAGTDDASWADYFDLGYSNTELSASGNMFRFSGGSRWGRLMVFDKSQMYAGGGAGYWQLWGLTNNDGSPAFSLRAAKMQAAWSEGGYNADAYFVNSRNWGGNQITHWKIRDVFSSNLWSRTDTVVGNYTTPPDAVQPDGTALDTLDCRLMPATITVDYQNGNGIELFTSLNAAQGSDCRAALYKFDAVTYALEFESLYGSPGYDYWMASPAADYSGSCFWVLTTTANSDGNEPDVRFVSMNRGAFDSASVLVRAGEHSYGAFRWGDYFGGQMDWGDYNVNGATGAQKVWFYGEFGHSSGNWSTQVGASSVHPKGYISGVSPQTTWVISGPPGGPFSPASQNYHISSFSGDVGVAFQVTGFPGWLDADRTYGQLWSGETITLSVNSNANGGAMGVYDETVTFTDCFNGGAQFTRNIQLRIEAPDLEVLSCLAGDGTYNPGDTIGVSGQYRNTGNLSTGMFTADFYASANTFISPSDEYLGSRTYASLNAGATMNFGTHFLALPCMAEQPYYIGVIVSVDDDANTSDNVGYDPTTIGYEYCAGDFNSDCAVNTLDVLGFLNAWSAGDLAADCDGSGTINTLDVLCFLNAWTAGC